MILKNKMGLKLNRIGSLKIEINYVALFNVQIELINEKCNISFFEYEGKVFVFKVAHLLLFFKSVSTSCF